MSDELKSPDGQSAHEKSTVNRLQRFLHVFGWGGEKPRNGRGALFPVSLTTHFILFAFGLLSGMGVYYGVSLSLYEDYQRSLRNASVICDFLTDYGASPHFNCEENLGVRFQSHPFESHSGEVISHPRKHERLSTKDLASIMIAANISVEEDLEEPASLLEIEKSGPGGWLATAILNSRTPSNDNLDAVMLTGATTACQPGDDEGKVNFGTLSALNVILENIGSQSTDEASCDDKMASIKDVTNTMIQNITGSPPMFWSPFYDGAVVSPSNTIKSAMVDPWNHYMPAVIFHAPELATEDLPSGMTKIEITENGVADYYTETTDAGLKPFSIDKTTWFRYDPAKLYQATFTLGAFLINEVFRDGDVKKSRFLFQAWRGPIQFALLVIFFYVVFMLLWRLVAAIRRSTVNHAFYFWDPVLLDGKIVDREQQAQDSRAYIDLIISTLPLIGLFGTVVGILFGLPNAADAVTAVGPGAADSVNALFENLGLAFSTTAIAVLSVIVLEVVWLILQKHEEQAISDYVDHHPEP